MRRSSASSTAAVVSCFVTPVAIASGTVGSAAAAVAADAAKCSTPAGCWSPIVEKIDSGVEILLVQAAAVARSDH